MQIIKSKKEKVKGYACAPSVLAGAAVMGALATAVLIVLWYNGFLTDVLILIVIGPMEVVGWMGVFWFISMDEHVYLYPDHLVCTRPFRKSVVLYYDRCMVGMDYATTTGSTNWWIYLSYGPLPKYKGNSPANRINSLRTNQEFVRIMYYEEVYEALLQVLPKHQKVCLQSAYHMRCRDAR